MVDDGSVVNTQNGQLNRWRLMTQTSGSSEGRRWTERERERWLVLLSKCCLVLLSSKGYSWSIGGSYFPSQVNVYPLAVNALWMVTWWLTMMNHGQWSSMIHKTKNFRVDGSTQVLAGCHCCLGCVLAQGHPPPPPQLLFVGIQTSSGHDSRCCRIDQKPQA